MRDILFKNLTSQDRKKRVMASSEIVEQEGVRSIIRRHFVCLINEARPDEKAPGLPYLYILKARSQKEQRERFFCKVKGSLHTVQRGKIYAIQYLHSLDINLEHRGNLA